MKKIDSKYIDSLHQRQLALDQKIAQRQTQRIKANNLFIDHIKKQMEMLLNQKEKMDVRNQQFLKSTNSYTKSFSKALPQLIEAQDNLKKAKATYLAFLQKNMR